MNKDIVEAGKKTQFGQEGGADPKEAREKSSPWSIRMATKRIARMTVTEAKAMADRKNELTMAQAVAAMKFQRALNGDVRAMQQLEDSIDGKLVEKRVEAKTSLEDLVMASLEGDEGNERVTEISEGD